MRTMLVAAVYGALGAAAMAQNGGQPSAPPAPTAQAPAETVRPVPASAVPGVGLGEPDPAEALYGISLMAVKPPKPRTYQLHGLVTIVVDESSQQQADQTLNTDKKYANNASVNAVIDPVQLLNLRLRGGDLSNLKMLDIASNQKFDGTGKYSRNDKLSLKIEAEIIDVKPNGTLTVEARKTVDKDSETMTTVLSGVCRPEDITANNTVFSSQLANLTLITRTEGQVKDAAKKGIIPKVLETLFAF